ncbi:MAG: hypothetical protein ACTHJQ_25855 [Rhizobiaceae bacterium]
MPKSRQYRPWLPVGVRQDNETPLNRLNDLEINKADCVALQAMATGTASAEQQKRALAAILHIAGTDDMEFLPDEHGGERDSAFKAGKRHVGLQLRKLVSFPLNVLTGEQKQ